MAGNNFRLGCDIGNALYTAQPSLHFQKKFRMKSPDHSSAATPSPMQSLLMVVGGMKGPSCAASVASALQLIGGVVRVEVSLQRAQAVILFDPRKAQPQQFQTAVRAVGYRPVLDVLDEDVQAAA